MWPEVIALVTGGTFVYHHFGYPVLLRTVARFASRSTRCHLGDRRESRPEVPEVTLIVPAHNEEAVIAAKIQNVAALDYPRDKLRVIIVCDGCTDATVNIANRAIDVHASHLNITLRSNAVNLGKIGVLNAEIAAATSEIIAVSDASALIDFDALRLAVAHFSDALVAVVCPTYRLKEAGSDGERAYWMYQTRIKADEAHLGAPIGAHGACYLFRRSLWEELPNDTINDDVILPMRMVIKGFRAVYDTSFGATEIERTQRQQEWRRRIRISAGNAQQVVRLWRLADPRRPGLAFAFISGKALRPAIPFLALATLGSTVYASFEGDSVMIAFLFVQMILVALALVAVLLPKERVPRPGRLLGYLVEGHSANFVGVMRYALGLERKPWRRAAEAPIGSPCRAASCDTFLPRTISLSKRAVDIVCGLVALVVLVVLFVPIALAIKLTSKGPIFYRQLRVGQVTPTATHLFYLIKFRTMRVDAEAGSGAVWATKNDPRITRVGNFLRKTRLDELPQCINVLKGEMSAVGPRPERPSFFAKLEEAIPLYVERTYGLKPGITGLAQVNQAYDSSIEDVRNKALYDHAYAARLTSWWRWLATDFGIVFKTVTVMALGKGQ